MPVLPMRLKRGLALAAAGHVHQRFSQSFDVTSSDGCTVYRVRLDDTSCTCPDSTYRGIRCKHLLGAALVHLVTITADQERRVRPQRVAARRGHPIWYEVVR